MHYTNKRIYITFKNGHIENHLSSNPITNENLKSNLKDIATSMAYLHSIEYLTPQEIEEKEMKAKEKDAKGGKKVDPKKKGQEVVVEQEEKVEEEIKVVRSKHFIKLIGDVIEG